MEIKKKRKAKQNFMKTNEVYKERQKTIVKKRHKQNKKQFSKSFENSY